MTEEKNALDYLEQAQRFLLEVDRSPLAWKWVVIALHGAVYGFAIAALRGTNPDRVTLRTRTGEGKLISFWEALKRCQDPKWMRMTIFSQPLVLTDSQRESLRKLKTILRNEFEHYVPKSWDIELHGMPQIASDVLDVVRFLALETGNYVHLNRLQQNRVRSIVGRSKRALLASELHQETLNREDRHKGRS